MFEVLYSIGNNDYNCILLESNYSFLLPNNYNNADAIHVSDLSNKTIGSLHLRVCYLSVTDTACVTDIPTDFLIAFPSIDRVYAFDTNEFLVHCSDYYSISGGVSTVFNFMGGNTGIYAQVVYHRGSTCMGVSNIGSRSVDGTTIYYDNLYWNDQTYNYRDENGLQSEVRIWNNLYPYDPILDRIEN